MAKTVKKAKKKLQPDTSRKAGEAAIATATMTNLRNFRRGLTIFVVLATSIPYLLNWLATPAGFHYTWIVPPYPEDSYAYMAWTQQAAHGNLLFQIKYTALPQHAFLFHPFFLICGWISVLSGCEAGFVLWLAKSAGVVLFFATFFKYSDFLGLNRIESVVASLLTGISAGLGGLFILFGVGGQSPVFPSDLWMPEMSTFWSLLWNPLFPWSLAMMVLTIYWLDRGTRDGRKSDFWFSGLSTGVLALIHPYSQLLLYAFAVTIILARRRPKIVGCLCRYFSAAFPFVLYLVLVTEFDPLVSKHSAHGQMPSPSLVNYSLGFGIPLLLCVAGLAVGRGRLIKCHWQVTLWFFLSISFAYLPVWFQRKFIFGAHIPLCILAGISVDLMRDRLSRMLARWRILTVAAGILMSLTVFTPIYLLISQSREVKENADHGAYFISNEMMEGLKFLKEKTKPDEVVFASTETSRLIPAYSGNTVLWGHWAMSVDFREKETWFNNLFHGQPNWDDGGRAGEFWGTGIQYIFADGDLEQWVKKNPPEWRVILNEADMVFTNRLVTIYKHRSG
jgi:hypothetical protein